ncbi:MAG: hypothetical protein JO297_02420 [Nitrososphaeraceae archaeon]|nr:hypothetical protein [Nitrososphaeraceae archaeon]
MNESLAPPSNEVKIKLKHRDWEVEINCLESKVKTIVEDVLSGIDTSTATTQSLNSKIAEFQREINSLKLQINSGIYQTHKVKSISAQRVDILRGGATTCRGILEKLWYEGYFETEKPLGEIHEEISRRGYNYDRTAVSHSLTDMVRESILTRIGTMRSYRYAQKRPPSESPL